MRPAIHSSIPAGLVAVAAAALFAGCLSMKSESAVETRCWTVECGAPAATASAPGAEARAPDTVRVGVVTVMSPWDSVNIMVRRADGSVARDPYNLFAAAPASLLKGPLMALASGGAFGRVMAGGTSAAADSVLELTVSDLSLDCSGGGRFASVSLTAALVSASGRKVVCAGAGSGRADASSGNYTAAFSEAFAAAVGNAFSQMK